MNQHLTRYLVSAKLIIIIYLACTNSSLFSLICLRRYGTSTYDTFKKMGLPYLTPLPFIGNMIERRRMVGKSARYIVGLNRFPKSQYNINLIS